MRTLNAKDKVEKRTKRLKLFVAFLKGYSAEGTAYTMKEAKAQFPEAETIEWRFQI